MTTTYTLVSYKASNDVYSRGCLMESYSSDFSIVFCKTPEEIAKEIVSIKQLAIDPDENEYEMYLLADGVELKAGNDEWHVIFAKVAAELQRITEEKQAALIEAQRKKQEEDAANAAETARQNEIKERAEYERLRAKFG